MNQRQAQELGVTDDLLDLDETDPRVQALGSAIWPNRQPVVEGVIPFEDVPQESGAVELDPVEEA